MNGLRTLLALELQALLARRLWRWGMAVACLLAACSAYFAGAANPESIVAHENGWRSLAGGLGPALMFAGLAAVVASYVVRHTTADRFGPSYAAATLAFGVSQMLSPQIGGLIADATGSFTLVFALSATFALCGAVASSRLPR